MRPNSAPSSVARGNQDHQKGARDVFDKLKHQPKKLIFENWFSVEHIKMKIA